MRCVSAKMKSSLGKENRQQWIDLGMGIDIKWINCILWVALSKLGEDRKDLCEKMDFFPSTLQFAGVTINETQ